jgi:hypothetical protein
LEKQGTPIDGMMVYIRTDKSGFRVVQNRFDANGGRFVMFKEFSAPGEVAAEGPPTPSSAPAKEKQRVYFPGKCTGCGKDIKKGEGIMFGASALAYLSVRPFPCKSCRRAVCGDCGVKLKWVCPCCGGSIGD